jgi:chaperone BCS1
VTYVAVGSDWRQFGHPKNKRPIKSVVLAPGLSSQITGDISEFLKSSQWYHDRGENELISFRKIWNLESR